MAKKMKSTAIVSFLAAIILASVYLMTLNDVIFSLLITSATISYHFIMRLAVGYIWNAVLHNRVDYKKKWFQVSEAEQKLYKKLNVKKWKNKMPTYDASVFDNTLHSWDEIAQAMCQSELVHETIMILSFVPVGLSVWFGSLPVFLITSVLSACFDGMFVIMQRFNRPRIIRLIRN